MDAYRNHIVKILEKHTTLKDIELAVPPNPEMGDFAFACFALAKEKKDNPKSVAETLAKEIKTDDHIADVKALGPYLNFFINKQSLIQSTIVDVLKKADDYGKTNVGKGKEINVEHTSINPNASPHVGRARNAFIGDAVSRILRFNNYKVTVHYLVNDIGKQIAMLVLASRQKDTVTFDDLLSLYSDFAKKVEADKAVEQEVFDVLAQLEKGDKNVQKEFKTIVDVCITGQTDIFKQLDIHYDVFDYESKYLFSDKTTETLRAFEKTRKFQIDKDNRFILDLQGFELGMESPVLVLTRGDGTSLYPLRDICYALDVGTEKDYVWILGEDHKLYSEQINAALKILGKPPRKPTYYSFVLLDEGKMSTRKGTVVLLTEFMDQAREKAAAELKNRYDKIDDSAAATIGYGALKFSILRVSPEKNVTFNWDSALSFDGETAPYIQYAYARIASILRKHGKQASSAADCSVLKEQTEFLLAKKVAEFSQVVEKAGKEMRPNIIGNYAYDVAKAFNEFYHEVQVITDDQKVTDSRIALIAAVQQTIKNALALYGIGVLEKM